MAAPAPDAVGGPGAATVAAFDLLDAAPFPSGSMARPATLLLDRQGRVIRWWIAESYRKRVPPETILASFE